MAAMALLESARAVRHWARQPEANALLAPLSNQFNFYGQLAAEELGTSISTVPQTYRPDDDEVEAIAKEPGIVRALTLYGIGLRYEGALEWQWAIKDYDDKQLLAAAELASRNQWYERAIDTAERTVLLHDFGLRFPTPYREVVQDYASRLDLDEAWVYGLVRQESRFVHTARSTAGASGLMQLMPSTARWVAKRLGLSGHHATLTATADSNIVLGTYYLRQMMDSLDNQMVLASAGYNAGPRRAREWMAGRSLGGRGLYRDHPVSRNARVRQARHEQHAVLCAAAAPAADPVCASGSAPCPPNVAEQLTVGGNRRLIIPFPRVLAAPVRRVDA